MQFDNKERANAVISIVSKLLDAQLELQRKGVRVTGEEPNFSTKDVFARGYIFGLADCARLAAEVGDDDDDALTIIYAVHLKFFGDDDGDVIFMQSIEDQSDPSFQLGRSKGGKDFFEFNENDAPPLGFFHYLTVGKTDSQE